MGTKRRSRATYLASVIALLFPGVAPTESESGVTTWTGLSGFDVVSAVKAASEPWLKAGFLVEALTSTGSGSLDLDMPGACALASEHHYALAWTNVGLLETFAVCVQVFTFGQSRESGYIISVANPPIV